MPKHCPRCAYATPDEWADECPFCLVTLARVRPAGPAPLAAPASRPFRRLPTRLLLVLGLFVGAVGLAFAMGAHVLVTDDLALGPVNQADSTGRIRAGMTAAAVARALDMDDPGSDFTGRFVWQKKGRLLRVRFRDGRVTGVEEGKALVPRDGLERAEIHYHN